MITCILFIVPGRRWKHIIVIEFTSHWHWAHTASKDTPANIILKYKLFLFFELGLPVLMVVVFGYKFKQDAGY